MYVYVACIKRRTWNSSAVNVSTRVQGIGVSAHVCTYICVYVCVRVHIVCMRIWIYMRICVCICMYVCLYTCVCVRAHVVCMRECMCICKYLVCMYACFVRIPWVTLSSIGYTLSDLRKYFIYMYTMIYEIFHQVKV